LKAVNDGLGHAAGDALLTAVAAALGRCVRARDLVARFGGDEFALIQRDATPESVRILARRLREAVARPTALGEQQRTTVPEVSIGSALYADDADDAATLVRAADARLYAQKRRRREDRRGVDPVTVAAPLTIGGR
jgi:diguanylate cyclase (GGDEF)-like protein